MADSAGLNARSVISHEMNHLWAEVKINDTWIIVDPANVVANKGKTGYNLSYESFRQHYPTSGNVAYVFAEWPNGTKMPRTDDYIDEMSQVNISVIDENDNPIPNARIEVFSNNRNSGQDIELSFNSNIDGEYQLEVGKGSITVYSSTDGFIFLSGEKTIKLGGNQSYNLTIKLKKDYSNILWALFIFLLFFLFFIAPYLKKKIKPKRKANTNIWKDEESFVKE